MDELNKKEEKKDDKMEDKSESKKESIMTTTTEMTEEEKDKQKTEFVQKKGKPLDVEALRKDFIAIDKIKENVHKIWDDSNSLQMFEAIVNKMNEQRKEEIGTLKFDKDDADAVAFVTAASNLRAACFDITRQS